MTKYDAEWVRAEEEKRTFMAENGSVMRRRRAFFLRCWLGCFD